MSPTAVPSLDEFRQCVLAAYAPIMREMGFVELRPRHGKNRNHFAVCIGNATTVIEVEGIHWGTAAWTKIFRAPEIDGDPYGLPIHKLLQLRQRECPGKRKRRRRSAGQLAEIRETAAAILAHARDVLEGDFSKLEEIAEGERRLRQQQIERQPTSEQKAAAVAASQAGHAFKRGDYRKVVELLEPHLSNLSPAQRRRFETARGASRAQR
jgi:hypothetical protein